MAFRLLLGCTFIRAESEQNSSHPGVPGAGQFHAAVLTVCRALRLIVEDHVQQGTVDFNMAVVINKTQFPEFVHERAHARSCRADHLRQGLLADFRYDWPWPTFLAKIRQKQKRACQPHLPWLATVVSRRTRLINCSIRARSVPQERTIRWPVLSLLLRGAADSRAKRSLAKVCLSRRRL
jgi:hypothetical protein